MLSVRHMCDSTYIYYITVPDYREKAHLYNTECVNEDLGESERDDHVSY